MAQVRVLGGSIGIAASSAILAVQEKSQLAGVVPPGALSMGTSGLTAVQYTAVRQTFADAFTKDMQVSAAVAGVSILFALGTYRRNRPTMAEMRRQQIENEKERVRAARPNPPSASSAA